MRDPSWPLGEPHGPEFRLVSYAAWKKAASEHSIYPDRAVAFFEENLVIMVDRGMGYVRVIVGPHGDIVEMPFSNWNSGAPPVIPVHLDPRRQELSRAVQRAREIAPNAESMVAKIDWAPRDHARRRQVGELEVRRAMANALNRVLLDWNRKVELLGLECRECGKKSKNYRFVKTFGHGDRAFLVCPCCGASHSAAEVEQSLGPPQV